MTQSEASEFRKYVEDARRDSNYRFGINMKELQTQRLTQHVRLDPDSDPPLPDWAARLLDTSHLSKRTTIMLMRFHNRKIRERRLAKAAASFPQN